MRTTMNPLTLFMLKYTLTVNAASIIYRNTGNSAWIQQSGMQSVDAYCNTDPCTPILYANSNDGVNQQGIVIAASGGYQVMPYTICGDETVIEDGNGWYMCGSSTGQSVWVTASAVGVTAVLVEQDGANVNVPVVQNNGIYKITITQPDCSYSAPRAFSNDITYRFMNEAGFDFESATPPSVCQIQEDMQAGYNGFRLPATWGNMQANLNNPVDFSTGIPSLYINYIQQIGAAGYGMYLDPLHNFGRYNNCIIGDSACSATLDDLYNYMYAFGQAIVSLPKEVQALITGVELMNEPYDMTIDQVMAQQNKGAQALLDAGWTGKVLYSWGDYDQGRVASQWMPYYNSTTMTGNADLVTHLYPQSSGTPETGACTEDAVVLSQLDYMATYAREHGLKIHVTEFGSNTDPSCLLQMQNMIAAIQENYSDVFVGAAAWASGSFDSSYALWAGDGSSQNAALKEVGFLPGDPTAKPTVAPTFKPTAKPTTMIPTAVPTFRPSFRPTFFPSVKPSAPSSIPSSAPTSIQAKTNERDAIFWLSYVGAPIATGVLLLAIAGYAIYRQYQAKGNICGFFQSDRQIYVPLATAVETTDIENQAKVPSAPLFA